ncbi:MAG: hypothetical protein KDK39_07775 [Leptospiraceae bacterium]|nr:hypothetical protein [Leptospiraceae bacterium]
MEINGLNPELNTMLNQGQLSGSKIAHLIQLRTFVDQLAVRQYVPANEMAELKKRFGTAPNVSSWGDYFQTELASTWFEADDTEFKKILDTVRFDLIAAAQIFLDKDDRFCAAVEANGLAAYGKDAADWDASDEESAHLYILLQYYTDMQLDSERLTQSDLDWYHQHLNSITDVRAVG